MLQGREVRLFSARPPRPRTQRPREAVRTWSVGWWLPATASSSGTVPRAPLAWLQGRGKARACPAWKHHPSPQSKERITQNTALEGETGPRDPAGTCDMQQGARGIAPVLTGKDTGTGWLGGDATRGCGVDTQRGPQEVAQQLWNGSPIPPRGLNARQEDPDGHV